jgi:hypothetical protein
MERIHHHLTIGYALRALQSLVCKTQVLQRPPFRPPSARQDDKKTEEHKRQLALKAEYDYNATILSKFAFVVA